MNVIFSDLIIFSRYLKRRPNELLRRAQLYERLDPLAKRIQRRSAAVAEDIACKNEEFAGSMTRETTSISIASSTRNTEGMNLMSQNPSALQPQAMERPTLFKSNTAIPVARQVPGKTIRFGSSLSAVFGAAHRQRKLGCGPGSLPLQLRLKRFYDRLETLARESDTQAQLVSHSAFQNEHQYSFGIEKAEAPKERRLEDAQQVFRSLGSIAVGGIHYVRRGPLVREWYLAHDPPQPPIVLQYTACVLHDVASRLQLPRESRHVPAEQPKSTLC